MSVGPTPDVTGNIGIAAQGHNKVNRGEAVSRAELGATSRPLLRTLPASALRAVAVLRAWLGWPGS